MPNNREHLNFDLGFLDGSKSEPIHNHAREDSVSPPTFKWQNVFIAGGVAVAAITWITSAYDGRPRIPQTQPTAPQEFVFPQGQTTPKTASPSDTPPSNLINPYRQNPYTATPSEDDMVNTEGGEYKCRRSVATALDGMEPKGREQIDIEQTNLTREKNALDNLKLQMDLSGVTPYSDKLAIDGYNAMVKKYNATLARFKTDLSAHDAHLDAYNRQVDARNDYLTSHCTRNW